MTRLLGAIIAGGQARRFGSDKAVAHYRGRPMIDHVVDWLSPRVAATVVCGRSVPGLRDLPDRPAPGLGPLGGLAAALVHARDHGFDAVLSLPCDTPLLPQDLLSRLAGPGGAAYVADLPVIGLWPASRATALEAHLLASPDRSMRGAARALGAVPVAATIRNVNTPSDLAGLTADFG